MMAKELMEKGSVAELPALTAAGYSCPHPWGKASPSLHPEMFCIPFSPPPGCFPLLWDQHSAPLLGEPWAGSSPLRGAVGTMCWCLQTRDTCPQACTNPKLSFLVPTPPQLQWAGAKTKEICKSWAKDWALLISSSKEAALRFTPGGSRGVCVLC